jgi:hypothetical protein
MRIDAPSLTPLRLARIARWIGLWLIVAAHIVLWAGDRRAVTRILCVMRRGVSALLIVRAAALLPRHSCSARRSPRIAGAMRALLGGVVRRHLHGADGRDAIIALWRALTAPEKLIAILVRRLRRGLTRRQRTFTRPPRRLALAGAPLAPRPARADTS